MCFFVSQVVEEGQAKNVKLKVKLLKDQFLEDIEYEQRTGKTRIQDKEVEVIKR